MKSLVLLVTILVLPILITSHPHHDTDETEDQIRIKRAGSFDFIGHIKNGVISGLGSASAGAAGSSSGSSSGGKSFHPPVVEEVKFDGWTFKKSLFNTIFQAVKAITGGVTALKGKLIKGSGYLVSAKGKLIAAGGDAVSNVGKKIALSAKLVPPSAGHFAKLSGAGSAGPLSAHLSSGSSGSSSGHHSPPTGHGESFTSFDSPTGGSHGSYGAPAPSVSTSYGLPGISYSVHKPVAQQLNYIPPSSHSTSYKGPSTSYGAPAQTYGAAFEGPPSSYTGYSNTNHESYNEVNTKDKHNLYDFFSSSSGSLPAGAYKGPTYPTEGLQNAAEALRQILQKIPTHGGHSGGGGGTFELGNSEDAADVHPGEINIQNDYKDYKVQQYDIPADPVPAFKPLSNYVTVPKIPQSMYGVPLEISHSQSLTTAYGRPISDYQKPSPLIDVPLQYLPQYKQHHIPALSQNTYNVYHAMSLRRNNMPPKTSIHSKRSHYSTLKLQPQQQQQQTQIRTNTPQALVKTQSQKPITDVDSHVHQQQITHLHKTLGADFEIEKSIGFEIKNQQPSQIKRSIETTLADDKH